MLMLMFFEPELLYGVKCVCLFVCTCNANTRWVPANESYSDTGTGRLHFLGFSRL